MRYRSQPQNVVVACASPSCAVLSSGGRRGASSVEYAVVLSGILIVALLGLASLGARVREQLGQSAVALSGAAPSGGGVTGPTSDGGASAATMPPVEQLDSGLRNSLAFAALALAIGLSGWTWYQLRRAQPGELEEESPEESAESQAAKLTRLQAKRESLLRVLLNNTDVLMKSDLEVRHLMTRRVLCVSADATREEVQQILTDNQVHHLMVCDAQGKLVGLLSDRDVLGRRGKTVREMMTPRPRTIDPHASVNVAITILSTGRFSCLPVVDENGVQGVMTITDMMLTLQCTLQLLMRLTQSLPAEEECDSSIEQFARMDSELASHREQLAELVQLAAQRGQMETHPEWELLAARAEEILASTSRLSDQIGTTYRRARVRSQEISGLMAVRTDPVTGLANRKWLEDMLTAQCSLTTRYATPCSLLLARIDNLNLLLDAPDPTVLDHTVRELGTMVQGCVRVTDVAGRFSFDTFAVVMVQTPSDGAAVFHERLGELLIRCRAEGWQPAIRTAVVSIAPNENVDGLVRRCLEELAAAPVRKTAELSVPLAR